MFDVRNSAAAVNDPHGVESFRAPHLKFNGTRRFERGDKTSVEFPLMTSSSGRQFWLAGRLAGWLVCKVY